jgi:hypothetical protein
MCNSGKWHNFLFLGGAWLADCKGTLLVLNEKPKFFIHSFATAEATTQASKVIQTNYHFCITANAVHYLDAWISCMSY